MRVRHERRQRHHGVSVPRWFLLDPVSFAEAQAAIARLRFRWWRKILHRRRRGQP
jgi:hypothetical protein